MRRIMTVGIMCVWLASGLGLLAQEPAEQPTENRLPSRSERMIKRLSDTLSLSPEQVEQAREIYSKFHNKMDQLGKKLEAKITEILNDEQKREYEELQQARPERRSGRGGRMGASWTGWIEWGMKNMLNRLTEELSLTDEQRDKVKELFNESKEGIAKLVETLREQGSEGMDFQAIRGKFEELQKAGLEKIKSLLNSEQLKKLDELMKSGMTGFNRMLGRQSSAEEGIGRKSKSLSLREIINSLKMSPEETQVVKPMIEEILSLKSEFNQKAQQGRQELQALLDNETVSNKLIKEKLDKIRAEREEYIEKLNKAREELRELLTFEQEAQLVVMKVLK